MTHQGTQEARAKRGPQEKSHAADGFVRAEPDQIALPAQCVCCGIRAVQKAASVREWPPVCDRCLRSGWRG